MGNRMVVVAGRNMSKRLNDTYCLDLSDLAPGGYRRRMSLRATADLQNDLQNQIPRFVSNGKSQKQIDLLIRGMFVMKKNVFGL